MYNFIVGSMFDDFLICFIYTNIFICTKCYNKSCSNQNKSCNNHVVIKIWKKKVVNMEKEKKINGIKFYILTYDRFSDNSNDEIGDEMNHWYLLVKLVKSLL